MKQIKDLFTSKLFKSKYTQSVTLTAISSLAFLAIMMLPVLAQNSGGSINICGTQFESSVSLLINMLIAFGMIGSAVYAIYQHVLYSTGRDSNADSSRNQAISGIVMIPLIAYALKALIVNVLGYNNLGCIFPF